MITFSSASKFLTAASAMALLIALTPQAMAQQDAAAELTAAATMAAVEGEAEQIAPSIAPAPAATKTTTVTETTVETKKTEQAPMPIMPASDMKAAEAAATPAVIEKPAPVKSAKTALTPEGDLPPPAEALMPVPKATEQQALIPAVTEPAKAAKASATTGNVAVTAGEAAIVQNGQVLNQLTTPAVPAVDMTPRPAVIKNAPAQYLVVKKTHNETDVDSRLTAARQALSSGNNQAAAQLFNELSREYPKDARIQMGRAVALQRIGQTDQAIAAYENVLTANPKNLEALTNMLGLIKVENPGLAVEKLSALRDTYPENADITAQLALSYAATGAYEDALRYLDIAEALSPGDSNILYNKAVLYDKMGRRQEAGELYRQILRMSDDAGFDGSINIDAVKRRLSAMH